MPKRGGRLRGHGGMVTAARAPSLRERGAVPPPPLIWGECLPPDRGRRLLSLSSSLGHRPRDQSGCAVAFFQRPAARRRQPPPSGHGLEAIIYVPDLETAWRGTHLRAT